MTIEETKAAAICFLVSQDFLRGRPVPTSSFDPHYLLNSPIRLLFEPAEGCELKKLFRQICVHKVEPHA